MRTERITSAQHPLYAQAMEVYRNSFPSHEQRELRHRSASCTTAPTLTAVYDGDVFVGLVLYWETEAYLYIEHAALAV